MYHGILLNKSFVNQQIPESLNIIKQETSGDWIVYCIEFEDEALDNTLEIVMENMVEAGDWYNHFCNLKI